MLRVRDDFIALVAVDQFFPWQHYPTKLTWNQRLFTMKLHMHFKTNCIDSNRVFALLTTPKLAGMCLMLFHTLQWVNLIAIGVV